jgi:transposase InsO family protein
MSRRGNCHDNAVAESFFQLLKRERIKKRSTERGKKPAAIFLITSKCFITVSVGMVLAIRCHRQNMKTSIINGSEVSRLSVAIQGFLLFATQHGNKPPSRHEAKSLKRHVDYTGTVLFLTRYIHALCCLAL